MENRNKILIVDDDVDIREFLSYNLGHAGYDVDCAENGTEALYKATNNTPDLILLDIMMPGADGIEVCKQLRDLPELNRVIIVFLSARAEDYSQIAGFDAGADDYITKPVKPKIIVKKIESLLRHHKRLLNDLESKGEYPTKFIYNNINVDIEMHRVLKDGVEVTLPKKEFKLLKLLISKPGKVFTRDEIYFAIWGNKIVVGDRTIDVHIRKLREKIGNELIVTMKGIGYKFNYQS